MATKTIKIMRSVVNPHITKDVMTLLGMSSQELAKATESAIAQIQTAVNIMLQWQLKNDEEQTIDMSDVRDWEAALISNGYLIDLAEIHEGYGENFNSHINYVNINGAYCDWNKLLVFGDDTYILFCTDRIGTATAITLSVPNRKGEKKEYAAVNIKQLDLQSAWRVMQYLSMATTECTDYWRIYEEC